MKALTSYFPWKRANEEPRTPAVRREPFDSPFQLMERWMENFDRWFDESWPTWPARSRAPYAFEDEDDAVTLRVDVPGFAPEDLAIEVSADQVTVSAKHEDKKSDKRNHSSRRAEVHYSFTVPSEVDTEHATAEVKHGVLTLRLPKTEQARRRTRKITVQA